jgi:hypothetical protein
MILRDAACEEQQSLHLIAGAASLAVSGAEAADEVQVQQG